MAGDMPTPRLTGVPSVTAFSSRSTVMAPPAVLMLLKLMVSAASAVSPSPLASNVTSA